MSRSFIPWLILISESCLALDPSLPNFVFILTDDQDLVFDSMDYMPFTKHFFETNGMTFTNAFIATPICCPSRTESITGRGFHNIRQQPVDCMDISARFNVFNNTQSMFQMFHGHGYDTSTFGKLTNNMNAYFCAHSPPFTSGFDRIHCPCDYNDFYGTEYMNYYPNGTVHIDHHLPLTPEVYETSMVGNATMEYLAEIIVDPDHDRPFMTWIGIHAPHWPADPAVWYKRMLSITFRVALCFYQFLRIESLSFFTSILSADLYSNETAPRTPHFNVHVTGHHGFVSTNPELTEYAISWIDQSWRDRLRSLLSADDLVQDIVQLLDSHKVLQNTFILFSSDHGYHLGTGPLHLFVLLFEKNFCENLENENEDISRVHVVCVQGQWRIPCAKAQLYETDIRIPTYISGPNVEGKSVSKAMVSNIDFLPTMLDLAGIEYAVNDYDGMSWVRGGILNVSNFSKSATSTIEKWRDRLLIQYGQASHLTFSESHLTFSQCKTWFPASNGSFRGQDPRPPAANPQGEAWVINDHLTNQWRAIRIINESVNAIYAEFVDDFNNLTLLNDPNFIEYYDIDLDPYQIDNVYSELDEDTKHELHQMLKEYAVCSGKDCW